MIYEFGILLSWLDSKIQQCNWVGNN